MSKKLEIVKRYLPYIAIIVTLMIADQISKNLMISYLKQQIGYSKEITPFLNMVYSWNYGISFGLMSDYYQYSNYAFLILNSGIITYLCSLLCNETSSIAKISLSFIIGGALGNLADRFIKGAVFDFIYFYYEDYSFAAFNLADSFITMGGTLFFCHYLYNYSKKEQVTK
jgi:signal peptidase II